MIVQAAVNMIQFRGDIAVSASGDHMIKIWSIETGQCLKTLEGHERGVREVQVPHAVE
jgi:F-box and WD-40 domain protein 1/11